MQNTLVNLLISEVKVRKYVCFWFLTLAYVNIWESPYF